MVKPDSTQSSAGKPQWQLYAKRDAQAGKSYVLLQGENGKQQLSVFSSLNPSKPEQIYTDAEAITRFQQAIASKDPVKVGITQAEAWKNKHVLHVTSNGIVDDPQADHRLRDVALTAAALAGLTLAAVKGKNVLPTLLKTAKSLPLSKTAIAPTTTPVTSAVTRTVTPELGQLKPGQRLTQWLQQKSPALSEPVALTSQNAANAASVLMPDVKASLKTPSALTQIKPPIYQLTTAQQVAQAYQQANLTLQEKNALAKQLQGLLSGQQKSATSRLAQANTPLLKHHITQIVDDVLPGAAQHMTPTQVNQAQALIAGMLSKKQIANATPALDAAVEKLTGTPQRALYDQVANTLANRYDSATRQRVLTQLAEKLPELSPAQLTQLKAALEKNPLAGAAAPKALLPQAANAAPVDAALAKLNTPARMTPRDWQQLVNSPQVVHHPQALPVAKHRLAAVENRLADVDALLANPATPKWRKTLHQWEKKAFEVEQAHMQTLNNAAQNGTKRAKDWLKNTLRRTRQQPASGKLTQQTAKTATPVMTQTTAKPVAGVKGQSNPGTMVQPGSLATVGYHADSPGKLLRQAVDKLDDTQPLTKDLQALLQQHKPSAQLAGHAGKASQVMAPYDDNIAQIVNKLVPGGLDAIRRTAPETLPAVIKQSKQLVARHLTQQQLNQGLPALNAAKAQLARTAPDTAKQADAVIKQLERTYASNPVFAQQASQQILDNLNNGSLKADALTALQAQLASATQKTANQTTAKLGGQTPTQKALQALPPGRQATPINNATANTVNQAGIAPQQLDALVNHPDPQKFAQLWQKSNQRLQTLQGRLEQLDAILAKPGTSAAMRLVHEKEQAAIRWEMTQIQDGASALWQIVAPLIYATF